MGDRKGRSEKKKDWLGNTYVQHYNSKGEKSGKSEFKKDWLGNNYTQHQNSKGEKTGRSERKKDWLGNNYTQKYNSRGEKRGKSENKKDWLGNKYTQHYNKQGEKSDVSERKSDWLGNKYTDRVEKKSKGWCFLTTACVEAQHLSDDCKELTVLRRFRDEYVLNQENGPALLKEYYAISPIIVSRIKEDPKARIILQDIFQDILQAVRLIESKKHSEAFALYCALVNSLTIRFI